MDAVTNHTVATVRISPRKKNKRRNKAEFKSKKKAGIAGRRDKCAQHKFKAGNVIEDQS